MAEGRILLADPNRDLGERAAGLMREAGPGVQLVHCEDGFKCVSVFARLARAKKPPVLIVTDVDLPTLNGSATAQAVRAIEAGLGLPPTPLLFYTAAPADEAFRGFLTRLGRAVHLQRPDGLPDDEQARRLVAAIGKLLAKLKGAR